MHDLRDAFSAPDSTPSLDDGQKPSVWSRRILPGIVIATVVLIAMTLGGWFWTGLFTLGFFQGYKELSALMHAKNISPSKAIAVPVGFLLIVCAAFNKVNYLTPLITLGIIASFVSLVFRRPTGSISDIGATLLAILYLGFLPAHYILLRSLNSGITTGLDSSALPGVFAGIFPEDGFGYVLFTIVVISISDIGAYYVGKAFGKHLLYPEISPKKTTEGAYGGILCGVLVAVLFAQLTNFPMHHALMLSILLVITGQLGDLSESLLKRDAGLKDSGGLLKGHGGILDRTDSYIFSGAVSYYYIHWIVLQQGIAQDVLQLLEMPLLGFTPCCWVLT
ncbi:MAG: phosphatidate cytidylyltransferase [Vampirovibrio sp.]|nr:phosphatidate cytidylyltransferase [Vampirovibrio sp.]